MSHYAIVEKNENTSRIIVIEKVAENNRHVADIYETDGTSKASIMKLMSVAMSDYAGLIFTDKKSMYDF